MAQAYRLEVAAPKTNTVNEFTQQFTPDTRNVISIQTELKKEKGRISYLTAAIFDPGLAIFSALPDPAFSDIPVRLYLAKPGDPLSISTLVFEGKATSYHMNFPGPETTTIVAHDTSIDARKQKLYRTFHNKTSIQILKAVAKDYGYEVEVGDLGELVPVQRTIDMGAELSDWDHVSRACSVDGLELVHKGNKVTVRQSVKIAYPTFRKDQSPVIRLEAQINHIGSGTPNKQMANLEGEGTAKAIAGKLSAEAAKTGAKDRTHRTDPQGAPSASSTADQSQQTAHHEDARAKAWTNKVVQGRRRKDEATLHLTATPDFTMNHVANLEGWGAKIDRTWWPESIKHTITGQDYASTAISLCGSPSGAAIKAAGANLEGEETVKVVPK